MAKETNPRLAFERLFGNVEGQRNESLAKRQRYRKSISISRWRMPSLSQEKSGNAA